jgi:hypothetical protein
MVGTRSRAAITVAVAVALACTGLVVALMVSSWSTQGSDAIDDLPTVAEVIVATAHQHGISLPGLTPEERAALAADPVAPANVDAYTQLSRQLLGVAQIEGVESAVFLLGEVASISDEAAQVCPRLYDDLVATVESAATPIPATPC